MLGPPKYSRVTGLRSQALRSRISDLSTSNLSLQHRSIDSRRALIPSIRLPKASSEWAPPTPLPAVKSVATTSPWAGSPPLLAASTTLRLAPRPLPPAPPPPRSTLPAPTRPTSLRSSLSRRRRRTNWVAEALGGTLYDAMYIYSWRSQLRSI